ncbi:MAG TPA: CRISPR-associated endonuclease Cas2 [Candidatus Hydrogenedentes bacterium]|nr:CRISPR-associated endonuclease Cas2 [Candidatus Hydrogenedentota bacterium]HRT20260.1 CRISPR-associated endonuclease Cas2 [Candidatus Hydrogenedentota bacterium]HRT64323.1 CRISPR-associated endonuclease Cas2 [Candidatus Hydrogenedentota bacterium]
MQTLVAFDIGNDRLRKQVETACRDAAMERTQFSAFLGELDEDEREKLLDTIQQLIRQYLKQEKKDDQDRKLCIQMFPICAADFNKAVQLGRESRTPVEPCRLPPIMIL